MYPGTRIPLFIQSNHHHRQDESSIGRGIATDKKVWDDCILQQREMGGNNRRQEILSLHISCICVCISSIRAMIALSSPFILFRRKSTTSLPNLNPIQTLSSPEKQRANKKKRKKRKKRTNKKKNKDTQARQTAYVLSPPTLARARRFSSGSL